MSTGHVLIDDHLLVRVLLGDEPVGLRPRSGRLATTGLWYHRLCRALTASNVTGALSRALGQTDSRLGARTVHAVTDLPDEIRLVSLRDLAWPMAELLADSTRLNLMSLEALAAAEHLGAELCLAVDDENPHLLAAAERRGVPARLIPG